MTGRLALATLLAATPSLAHADAIDEPNVDCPSGSTAESDHSGSYCRPSPPDSCPAGYVPRTYRDEAYCEPPPATACPPGSDWASEGPDRGRCWAGAECGGGVACGPGQTCRRVGLCLSYMGSGPRMDTFVHGACEAEGPCGDPAEQATCSLVERCDPDVRRADPQGRTLPAILAPRASGCGCRAASGPGGAGWIAALALFARRLRRR